VVQEHGLHVRPPRDLLASPYRSVLAGQPVCAHQALALKIKVFLESRKNNNIYDS